MNSKTLAFSHLNLRWNPFAEPAEGERMALALVDEIELGGLIQIIGEQGAGKTTHLLGIRAKNPEAVYEYVPEGATVFQSRPKQGQLFLLDEAQRVRPGQLRRLFRSVEHVVMGTHDDLRLHSKRPIHTRFLASPRPERLREIFEARIEWARRAPGDVPRISNATLDRLQTCYGHDIRAMEAELYERFQGLDGVREV